MAEARRVRRLWRLRQRYRRLAGLAAIGGGALAATGMAMLAMAALMAGTPPGIRFYLLGVLAVAAGGWLPWRIVRARWRRVRRDHLL